MCEIRDGKIVVLQGAATGWCIGQVTGAGNSLKKMCGDPVVLYPVDIMWVQKPEYRGGKSLLTGTFTEFDSVREAMDFLRTNDVIANA